MQYQKPLQDNYHFLCYDYVDTLDDHKNYYTFVLVCRVAMIDIVITTTLLIVIIAGTN